MAVQRTRYDSRQVGDWPTRDGNGTMLSRAQRGELHSNEGMTFAGEPLANALGWVSLGLGLAQLLAPGTVADMIGVRDDDKTRTVMRTIGLREIASGVGILSQPQPAGWVWARVAGDAMDLTLLSQALKSSQSDHDRVSDTLLAVAGITAVDLLCAQQLSRHSSSASDNAQQRGMLDVTKAITINQPPETVYQFWRDFQNLPRFMQHLQSVEVKDDGRSHWKTRAPAGATVEWDAEIVDDQPNQLIAWRSVEGADVDNAGTVQFTSAPGGRGTEVRVQLRYQPPGGAIGATIVNTIGKLFGESPDQQVYDDLRALKQVLETGEVVYSDASVHDHPHPARPAPQHMERHA
jgi:uncharacterized membrane protein